MGRQVQLHILPPDTGLLLQFIQERDPVIVTLRDTDSPDLSSVPDPLSETRVMTLWNQALLSSLRRKRIVHSAKQYYAIESSAPTIEFSPSELCQWNGRPALIRGRLYASFEQPIKGHEQWYSALVRWIRKNFAKVPIPLSAGYIGPVAYDWFKKGGLLLPMFRPPLTSRWLSWVEAQDQHRAVFTK
jgi:hypothetical protein